MSHVMNEHRFSYPTVVPLGPAVTDSYRTYGQASPETLLIRAGTERPAHADGGDAVGAKAANR
jgi:hypothetical protein